MWKKTTADDSRDPQGTPAPPAARSQAAPHQASGKPARIGASLSFKGDLFGEEDLVIEGKIEGRIVLKKASVTIGERGRVEADIEAASIQVAGSVKGDLTAAERVVLLETGRVEGNIKAKSVTLENGCRFKGSIDMESDSGVASRKESTSGASTTSKASAPAPVARAGV